jgi:hypothetical protein
MDYILGRKVTSDKKFDIWTISQFLHNERNHQYFFSSISISLTLFMIQVAEVWIDWLFVVLCPAEEYFTDMETSQLPVKDCKIKAYARRSRPLRWDWSLSCHTCCDIGLQFFWSHLKDHPIQLPLTTHKGRFGANLIKCCILLIYLMYFPDRTPILQTYAWSYLKFG